MRNPDECENQVFHLLKGRAFPFAGVNNLDPVPHALAVKYFGDRAVDHAKSVPNSKFIDDRGALPRQVRSH